MSRIFDHGFKEIFREAFSWLVRSIDKVLEYRKENLRSNRPGSLSTSAEPHIIWLTILKTPHNLHEDVIPKFKLVGKTNEVMENEIKRNEKYHHIMYMETVDEYKHFDNIGKLSGSGKS